ncbi:MULTISPECIES: hypothetical protein [Salinibaculum]
MALRALEGIDLVVDDTMVAEAVQLARYRTDRGVFESETLS